MFQDFFTVLDLHRLAFLRELAARGTITAVAEALAYTPSAVSQSLSSLERDLGVDLLERQGRRVVLTAAGRALVDHADAVFAATDQATSAAHAAAGLLAGPIHVGSFASVGATIIPATFARLADTHPTIAPHFRHFGDEGLHQLRLGHLDIWIDQHYSPLPHHHYDDLTEHELLVEPVQLAVPVGDDHSDDLTAYRHHTWAAGTPDSACGRLLHQLCNDAGFEPTIRHHTDDIEVILHLVAAGIAIAVLPRLALGRLPDGVTTHDLDGVTRRVIALTRTATTDRPIVRAVLDHLLAAESRDEPIKRR